MKNGCIGTSVFSSRSESDLHLKNIQTMITNKCNNNNHKCFMNNKKSKSGARPYIVCVCMSVWLLSKAQKKGKWTITISGFFLKKLMD